MLSVVWLEEMRRHHILLNSILLQLSSVLSAHEIPPWFNLQNFNDENWFPAHVENMEPTPLIIPLYLAIFHISFVKSHIETFPLKEQPQRNSDKPIDKPTYETNMSIKMFICSKTNFLSLGFYQLTGTHNRMAKFPTLKVRRRVKHVGLNSIWQMASECREKLRWIFKLFICRGISSWIPNEKQWKGRKIILRGNGMLKKHAESSTDDPTIRLI